MALKSFFTDQIETLKDFLIHRRQTLHCVRVEPDMRPLLIKILQGLDQDPQCPHLMLWSEVPFDNRRQYFEALLQELTEDLRRWEMPLKAAGFEFRPGPEQKRGLSPEAKFLAHAAALADALPANVGSLVLVLAPDRIGDAEGYRAAARFLADRTPTRWLKYLFIDGRKQPALAGIERECPRAGAQDFHITPEEIENRTRADLERGFGLSPTEKRQYMALLAGFAFARKEYDDALRLQQRSLEMLGPGDPAAEAANAHYNLGNTHLARKEYPAAEAAFGKALEIALDRQVDGLVPVVLTNLGVTLFRQGRREHAPQSFRVARDACKAQQLRPVEAHVLDCQAMTYEADGQLDEAERCWNEALAVYDSMSAETFAAAREGGRADIRHKLERLAASRKKAPEEAKPATKAGWFRWRKGA
jgi:tetratricopeptide (TPR) repeat protein